MSGYSTPLERCVEVEFHFTVDRGWTADDGDVITDLRATITGPKGERLDCPAWLADMLLDGDADLLLDAAGGADDQAREDMAEAAA